MGASRQDFTRTRGSEAAVAAAGGRRVRRARRHPVAASVGSRLLAEPFTFTKGVRTIRVAGHTFVNPYLHGTLLFDLESDPGQDRPLLDDEAELRMATLLVEAMRANDAPPSQFERLGLPYAGVVTGEHLLARAQRDVALAALEPLPDPDDYPAGRFSLRTPVQALISDDGERHDPDPRTQARGARAGRTLSRSLLGDRRPGGRLWDIVRPASGGAPRERG